MKHAREDYDRLQDPWGKIPHDEPVFLIRGQDRVGPLAVLAWAKLAEAIGAHPDIVSAAREQAGAMEKWHEDHRIKMPDLPQLAPGDKAFHG